MKNMLPHRLRNAPLPRPIGLLLAAMLVAGCATGIESRGNGVSSVAQTPAVRLTGVPSLAQIESRLAERRVVFVGERHVRPEDHRIQLEIVRYLAAQDRPLAIGVEWFQQPFQNALDRYLAGAIDERELLRATEYHERWGYDFRLYAPILRFARAHGIPVIALNVPTELTRAAARRDLHRLAPELRQWIPDTIDRSDAGYRRRLKRVYRSHPAHGQGDFQHFYTAQLLWDEGMAERAAEYLNKHPDTRMVILAGAGHLAYGAGIPNRVQRRTGIDGVIVLPGWDGELKAGLADYLLLPASQQLPEPGRLGVALMANAGRVIVDRFTDDSAARAAGLRAGDVLLAINGHPIESVGDVRTALWDHGPGDVIQVRVRRTMRPGDDRLLTFDITLR